MVRVIDVPANRQRRGFNIEEFRASIASHGYLDNNSYQVFVQPPLIMRNSSVVNNGTPINIADITTRLAFRIDQVRAPGISLITSDVSRYGVGPTQKQPTSAQFSEVNISVLGDHYCEFWQFWYQWTRHVFDYNSETNSSQPSYTSNYKEDYSSTIMIWISDHYGNIIQKINLFQAFPTAVREVPLAWGDPNLMKINVSIAYTEYVIEGVKVETNSQRQSAGGSAGAQREATTIGLTPTVVRK